MTKSILLVGVGGQGTILAGKILTTGLLSAGYDVKMSEIHGMSQRGGSVSTHVRYSKEQVHSAVIEKGGADVLISFEQMEAMRWLGYLKPGGRAVINSQVILPQSVLTGQREYPQGILEDIGSKVETTVLNATEEAAKIGNPRGQNVLLVGTAAKLLGLGDIDWKAIIAQNVKEQFVEMNQKAFDKGFELV
ncbi:MAG: indolepyruvate oxidoreductase subunit beta [Defluviitaleaceae bacterium]|nr:indolepyruvate oxidoreductase subunit beta [Defluviitaleaceae bacterium]